MNHYLSYCPSASDTCLLTPELKDRLASLQLDTQQPIIAICLSAHRSIPAVRLLRAKGLENAVQLKGGMLAWWSKNYPTEQAG